MKKILLIASLILSINCIWAQNFDKSIGARQGAASEIYFEKTNDDLSSFRVAASWRDNGRQLSVMKIHRTYGNEGLPENVSFYFGYGAHAGSVRWNQNISDSKGYYWDERSAPVIGLNAIVGLSYDFREYPISITLDAKPYFDFWGSSIFRTTPFNIAFGAAYHF
jgi:hypothetical protein